MLGPPPPPRIADAWPVGDSHVVEAVFADGLRGAADLRDLTPGGPPDIVDDGVALRWHDGTTVSAQVLLERVLRPPMRLPPMTAVEFVRWTDDGGDVRWELQRGTPIPRPGGSRGHAAVVGALSARLHCVGGWLAPVHAWVGGRADDIDLRMVDVAVVPDRPDAADAPPWWDNALVVVEVSEAATAYLERERLLALHRLPTLREVAVVSAGGEWARIERRADGDRWRREEIGPSGVLRLTSVDVEIPLADLRREGAR